MFALCSAWRIEPSIRRLDIVNQWETPEAGRLLVIAARKGIAAGVPESLPPVSTGLMPSGIQNPKQTNAKPATKVSSSGKEIAEMERNFMKHCSTCHLGKHILGSMSVMLPVDQMAMFL